MDSENKIIKALKGENQEEIDYAFNFIYNKYSKILILGSIPSVISRNQGFYYANKNNRFWTILESLFKVNLNSNEEKEKFLLNNNILQ